ncbi:Unknown protein, partial [Striga hermonthica]
MFFLEPVDLHRLVVPDRRLGPDDGLVLLAMLLLWVREGEDDEGPRRNLQMPRTMFDNNPKRYFLCFFFCLLFRAGQSSLPQGEKQHSCAIRIHPLLQSSENVCQGHPLQVRMRLDQIKGVQIEPIQPEILHYRVFEPIILRGGGFE